MKNINLGMIERLDRFQSMRIVFRDLTLKVTNNNKSRLEARRLKIL